MLKTTSVLSYNHDNVVKEKLEPMQRMLDLTDEEMKQAVVSLPQALSYINLEEKWALMMDRFAEEEGDAKVSALRRLGPRGLGVGLERLKDRLDDLDGLGCAPKASEWFIRLVKYMNAKWAEVTPWVDREEK